jgi:cytoskeleton protein RodZ
VSLFQRIKTPFEDVAEDIPDEPGFRARTVGVLLRERREELGFDLDAIGEALRIKPVYLAALEQGRAQELPGATYAIGFIRAYAQLLGLDSERILDSYKAECAEMHARPDLALPVPLGARSVPGGHILLVGVILAVCGYGTWYYLSTGERARPERVAAVPAELQRVAQGTAVPLPGGAPPAPSRTASSAGSSPAAAPPGPTLSSGFLAPQDFAPALSVTASGSASPSSPSPGPPNPGPPSPGLVASPAAAASPVPAGSVPTASGATAREAPGTRPNAVRLDAPDAASGDGGVKPGDADAKPGGRIDIRALADCWIQVRSADDQSIVFSRVLKAGETYHVPRAGLVLRTGNAGALAIGVDGKPAPTIGAIGTLRRNVALDPEALLAGTAVHG